MAIEENRATLARERLEAFFGTADLYEMTRKLNELKALLEQVKREAALRSPPCADR